MSSSPLRLRLSGRVDNASPQTSTIGGSRCSLAVLGVPIDILSGEEVLGIVRSLPDPASIHLAYVNAHSLNLAFTDPHFRAVLRRCDLVLNDGVGLHIAARMRGVRLQQNLNGSDFTWGLLSVAALRNWPVFLYGGKPGVASTAATRLTAGVPGLSIAGTLHGYGQESPAAVADRVRSSGAKVMIVALGQPKQELWLDAHLAQTGCALGLGVGAFLDFVSGRVRRAPSWMNRTGTEWLFRLSQEPTRLWRRYLLGNPAFILRAWCSRQTDVDFYSSTTVQLSESRDSV